MQRALKLVSQGAITGFTVVQQLMPEHLHTYELS